MPRRGSSARRDRSSIGAAGDPRDRGGPMQPMLIVTGLKKHFPIRGGLFNRKIGSVRAVDDVSFVVLKGETLGIVGESGCGKSTLARLLMHLIPRDAGELIFDGEACRRGPRSDRCASCAATCRWCSRTATPRSTRGCRCEDSIAYGPIVHGMSRSRGPEGRARPAREGRAEARPVRLALSARAVRRPEAARQHRARAGARARAC